MHLGILAERRPSSDEKVLHYHRDRGHSEDTFGIEGLVDFLKPARTEWDKKRGSDVSVEGDLDVVSDLLSQETVDKYQRGMTPVLKRASGGPMSGQMVQLDSPGLKVSDFQILTSSCVVLFPHLSALQGKLVEHCLTRLPTLPHQVCNMLFYTTCSSHMSRLRYPLGGNFGVSFLEFGLYHQLVLSYRLSPVETNLLVICIET